MIGHKTAYSKVFYIFGVLWGFVCPAILIVSVKKIILSLFNENMKMLIFQFLVIYGFVSYSRLTLDGNNSIDSDNYLYPIWAEVLGNLMNLAVVLGILLYALYAVIDVKRNKKVSLEHVFFLNSIIINKLI